jgi:hypothetical protein
LETVATDIKPGAGLAFWFTDKIGFSWDYLYREDANGTPDAPSHQHTAGLTFKFGGKDTDGDGIYDKMMMSRSCWFKRIQRLSWYWWRRNPR